MESRRIAWFNQFDPFHPWAGGAERHILEISSRLAGMGHSVTVIAERYRGLSRESEIDGFRILRPGGRLGVHLWAAANASRLRDYDVVVQDLSKILPWHRANRGRVPSVAIVRHLNGRGLMDEVLPMEGLALWGAERLYGRLLNGMPVLTESAVTRSALIRLGVHSGSIRLLRPGVDHSVYSPDLARRAPAPLILYAGRLRRYKRVDLALGAMTYLQHDWPEARMIIAGEGADSERLHQLTHDFGLGSKVTFTGRVEVEELVDLYRSAWVHVQPSAAEGWGYTVVEAAACGTPTVALKGTALEESVGPHCQPYHLDTPTPAALARALSRCLHDMQQGRNRLAQAMSSYSASFDWDSTTQAFAQVLLQTVDASTLALERSAAGEFDSTRLGSGPRPGAVWVGRSEVRPDSSASTQP